MLWHSKPITKYLQVWPTCSTAGSVSSIPCLVISLPTTAEPTASSLALSLQLSELSPLVLPAISHMPLSNSTAPSPTLGDVLPWVSSRPGLPEPLAESAPHCGRSATLVNPQWVFPRRFHLSLWFWMRHLLGLCPCLLIPAIVAHSVIEMEVCLPEKQQMSCQYCSTQQQQCATPKGAKLPFTYPCAACKQDKVQCVPPCAGGGLKAGDHWPQCASSLGMGHLVLPSRLLWLPML